MGWSFAPSQLVPIAVVAVLYARRARTLARRGRPVATGKLAGFGACRASVVLAVVSPVASIGEERLFSVHMLQHLLIGDLAPLLLALGLSGPLLRPLLKPKPVQRLQVLTQPLVALPLWALNLCIWHLPALYDAALAHPLVHAVQHVCFLTGGLLLWATLLGLLPGPRWYGFGARLASLGFVWLVRGRAAPG